MNAKVERSSYRGGQRYAPLAVVALFIGGCSSCFPQPSCSCDLSPDDKPGLSLSSGDGDTFTGGEVVATLTEANPDRVEIVASAVAGRRFWALQGYAPIEDWDTGRLVLELVPGEPTLGTASSATREDFNAEPVVAAGGTVIFTFSAGNYVTGQLLPSDDTISGTFVGQSVWSCWVFDPPGSDVLVETTDAAFCAPLRDR